MFDFDPGGEKVMVLLIGEHPALIRRILLAYACSPGDVEFLLPVIFPGILIVDVGACGKLLPGDLARNRGDGHGIFLVRFSCLFISDNLTLKLWHGTSSLASFLCEENQYLQGVVGS